MLIIIINQLNHLKQNWYKGELWVSRLPGLTPVTKAANPKEQVVPYVSEE